jgi:hypothetical protein
VDKRHLNLFLAMIKDNLRENGDPRKSGGQTQAIWFKREKTKKTNVNQIFLKKET